MSTMSRPYESHEFDAPSGGKYGTRGGRFSREYRDDPGEWDEGSESPWLENAVRAREDALSNLD